MISGRKEPPAAIGVAVCTQQTGPVWKLGGETCGCVLPSTHLDDSTSDHECSCGAWWARIPAEEGASHVNETARAQAGPAKPATGKKTRCCGDPTDLDGGAHPWVLVTDDGPGDVYRCPECGAVDVD